MSDWKLHTPTGVSDILPEQCGQKKEIEETLRMVYATMGYMEVETPSFEFYDVFAGHGGQISQENMFKFFDEKGRILTLRPDITTSIARLGATKDIGENLPLRFSYTGNVFRAEQTEGARLREFTQSGIELIGSDTPRADAEVIAASIEAMLALGLEEFHVEIGQVAFFNGLVSQSKISKDDAAVLCERVDNKDSIGISEILKKTDTDENIKKLILDLPYMFGGLEVTEKAEIDGLNADSKAALDNIRDIYNILCDYGFEKYISIDLGMLRRIDYYTGSIFRCFTNGVAFPICAGGRYDNLISKFGRNLSAVGAAFGVNRLMTALRKAGVESDGLLIPSTLIFTEKGADANAYSLAYNLRVNGCIVEMYIDDGDHRDAESYSKDKNIECMIRVFADGRVMIKDFEKNEIIETSMEEFIGYAAGDDEHSRCCGHEHDDCGCGHEHAHGCGCGHEH
ncbi:MAG: ATP phosphoribosyltransferase regulatory subunit [Oscillospiraceae bacterium]|nr:ATP phosphoribosyltransferase regulatory subunit [Oscillospiraceae bacterium]